MRFYPETDVYRRHVTCTCNIILLLRLRALRASQAPRFIERITRNLVLDAARTIFRGRPKRINISVILPCSIEGHRGETIASR